MTALAPGWSLGLVLVVAAPACASKRDTENARPAIAVQASAASPKPSATPAARFDARYQAAHRGRTRIAIPEVYELVNVAIALTPKAQESDGLVITDTPYYQDVVREFVALKDHPFVRQLDREMRRDANNYFSLKMNSYAFEYDRGGKIVRSPVYDRIAWDGTVPNDLLPLLDEMRDFSRVSRFRTFYAAHEPLYRSQIGHLQTKVDIAGMVGWLESTFPRVKPYDSVNIVFSPLVGWNQSLTALENNGFRELQPHVNFPYPAASDRTYSAEANAIRGGYILFTELNHGFINPTADAYTDRLNAALAERTAWVTANSPAASYRSAYELFNEMMNWGLVSLYIVDKAPAAERDKMIEALNPYMMRRGFPRFPAFNAYLVDLYQRRPPAATVESLYPQIVSWLEAQAGE